MIGGRHRTLVVMTAVGALSAGCGAKHPDLSAPSVSGRALVVLLPDPDGSVGRAKISNPSGSVNLTGARDAVQATPDEPPSPAAKLSDEDVARIFGDALSALPPAPKHFTLYFRFQSDELTAESRALVPEIQEAVLERPTADIIVVGHTDTMGTARANFDLGLKRAATVRRFLTSAGLNASSIDVTSLGETDLLIKTADETPEPRNRRVEIAVR